MHSWCTHVRSALGEAGLAALWASLAHTRTHPSSLQPIPLFPCAVGSVRLRGPAPSCCPQLTLGLAQEGQSHQGSGAKATPASQAAPEGSCAANYSQSNAGLTTRGGTNTRSRELPADIAATQPAPISTACSSKVQQAWQATGTFGWSL